MNRLCIYILCVLLSLTAMAQQRTQQRIDVGDDLYKKEQYTQAIKIYERILKKERSPVVRQELSYKMGESYRQLLNYEEAKKWYTIALNLGYDNPQIFLHLSEMTLGLEEFDTAQEYVENYLAINPTDSRALKMLESAKFSKQNYATQTQFEVANEKTLNSTGEEWGLAFLEPVTLFTDNQAKFDEQFDIDIRLRHNNVLYWALISRTPKDRIIFSSTAAQSSRIDARTGQGYSNIYQARYNKRNQDWETPVMLQGLNSSYYDGFLSYSEKDSIGYFMNSGGSDGSRPTSDIYFARYIANQDRWGEAKLFPFNDINYNIGYPSINEDGNILYFAADLPDGYGGYDIYKIIRDEAGNWGEPINLGPTINTPVNDAYPYIVGNVLYFSSFGHPGFGGFDIYYATIDEAGNYAAPINLGAPINSSADDFGFIIDAAYARGFFSSNRPGGNGSDDIYSFRIKSQQFTARGRVTDKTTGLPVGGLDLYFFDDANNVFTTTTDSQGYYDMPNLSTDVNYYVQAYPEKHQELADNISVREQLLANRFTVIKEFEKDFSLIPLNGVEDQTATPAVQAIQPVIIKEEPVAEKLPVVTEKPHTQPVFQLSSDGFPIIYFDFGNHRLRPGVTAQLDSVVTYMKANPNQSLIVNAHTDVISGYLFNFYLSQRRAYSIVDYLVKQGIEPQRLYAQGHGKKKLAKTNAQTDQEHQLNRRADFESISNSEFQAYLNNASIHSFHYLNSLDKEAHYAEGVEFMVQFIASRRPVDPQFYQKIMDTFPRLDIIYYYDTDRYHRYLVGSFKDFRTAYNLQRSLRELGYEIYIVAFHHGERISVTQAKRLIGDV